MADLKNNSEVLNDIRKIIEQGRHQAYAAAGQAAIATYWGIGRRIVEEEQHGDERAKYGTHLITELAAKLIPIFGNNYSKRNLQHYRKFYILFPDYSKVYEFVHNLECARRHFAAISERNVVFDVVKDYRSLYDVVAK